MHSYNSTPHLVGNSRVPICVRHFKHEVLPYRMSFRVRLPLQFAPGRWHYLSPGTLTPHGRIGSKGSKAAVSYCSMYKVVAVDSILAFPDAVSDLFCVCFRPYADTGCSLSTPKDDCRPLAE